MLDEITQMGFPAEVQLGGENGLFQLGADLVGFLLVEHHLVIVISDGLYVAEKCPRRQHQGLHREHRHFGEGSNIGVEFFGDVRLCDRKRPQPPFQPGR